MDALYIPNLLQSPDKTRVIEIETYFPELETLTPVRGQVKVTHQGTYLDVQGTGEAIITLTCDRCLQNYNHRLLVSPREMIWLQDGSEDEEFIPLEREVAVDDLVESLPPDGYFSADTWLYEQLCLALPQQQICSEACEGIPLSNHSSTQVNDQVDHRWAALAQLKTYLPEDDS
ncbi:MAG TPA: YceD family protein [Leptolyngbyaceae cyanobacterium]